MSQEEPGVSRRSPKSPSRKLATMPLPGPISTSFKKLAAKKPPGPQKYIAKKNVRKVRHHASLWPGNTLPKMLQKVCPHASRLVPEVLCNKFVRKVRPPRARGVLCKKIVLKLRRHA